MFFAVSASAIALILGGLVLWADPYGVRVRPGSQPPVLIDSNQRFMYPQLVRSGLYDSAVLGTSSSRLLDPQILSQLFGTRFANLAMNAATPWEQSQMMALIFKNWSVSAQTSQPAAIIWGLDATWCESDADTDKKRLTSRLFPQWLYQPDLPKHVVLSAGKMFNMAAFENAGKKALHLAGLAEARMRADGFDEFTPPDVTYDQARAQFHIYRNLGGKKPAALPPDALVADEAEIASRHFPALAWLEQGLAALPATTRKLIVLPPLHAASLPSYGAASRTQEAACKAAVLAIARRVDAALVDYRRISSLTTNDTRFWDPLHYRIDVARRIELDLASANTNAKLLSGDGILRHSQRR